tara:strand:+ start:595 stop:990 length:396 start_codon:yes stop_codon:yes gene_type:complete
LLERDIEDSIRKVIEYLKDLGVVVIFSKDVEFSTCDLFRYEITMPEEDDRESILYSLLHEAGHFFLEAENRDLPSNPDSLDVLFNEVLAWDRGREIAESLRLDFFEKDEYYEMSKESLEKYTSFFKLKIMQ